MYNIIQLNDKDLTELQQIAKELGLKKTSTLRKEELVYRILDEQAIVGATKKAAAAKSNEERKEGQPRKRSRISVKKKVTRFTLQPRTKHKNWKPILLRCLHPLHFSKMRTFRFQKIRQKVLPLQ